VPKKGNAHPKGLALEHHYGFSLLGPRHKNQLLSFALRKTVKPGLALILIHDTYRVSWEIFLIKKLSQFLHRVA
jgi:hypothetical protein